MNLWKFRNRFNKEILMKQGELPNLSDAPGWANERVQNTLNLAVSCLKGTGEAYLEVGSYGGKSLEAALTNNEGVPAYACDIDYQDSLKQIVKQRQVTFFHSAIEKVDLNQLEHPIGVYYFDGDHEYQPTYDGLRLIEPFLAEKALIFCDDYCYVRTYNAVRDFVRDRADNFTIVHEMWPECDIFQAMTNHCLDDWYNGWAVIEFEAEPQRLPLELDSAVLGSFHCNGGIVYPEKYKDIIEGLQK